MSFSFFIARRLIGKNEYRFSRPVIRIAIVAISLSITIMLLSLAIVKGFQKEITDKVIGFNSHIQVSNFLNGNSYESTILKQRDSLKLLISDIKGIKHIQSYATKAGIIKTDNEIQGVVLKGLTTDFDTTFIKKILIKGKIPKFRKLKKSNEILISQTIAKKLNLNIGDVFQMYFIQKPVRVRLFEISGIYDSGVSEFDEILVIGDIIQIQKLNKWGSNDIGGLEILINDLDQLESINKKVYHKIGFDLNTRTVIDNNPQLFDWLELQNMNVKVILILMLIVGAINMIVALFILIIERSQLIGLLKALGSKNWEIRKIFIYQALYLILIGMFWGNLVSLTLCWIQKQFNIIELDRSTYYMSYVPIDISLINILSLNLGTFILCWLILIIPSYLISKLNPIKAIRFE
ncbi:MAG: ABC transporter permease [Flavobacteriales bacterium]|nr:ABC transporter permease [Flavobacteriales bacterium]|tara:strand:+ start:17381 stop:18598 length:1218 start_codon:yes stop_codon:yes gene_type:complete